MQPGTRPALLFHPGGLGVGLLPAVPVLGLAAAELLLLAGRLLLLLCPAQSPALVLPGVDLEAERAVPALPRVVALPRVRITLRDVPDRALVVPHRLCPCGGLALCVCVCLCV